MSWCDSTEVISDCKYYPNGLTDSKRQSSVGNQDIIWTEMKN